MLSRTCSSCAACQLTSGQSCPLKAPLVRAQWATIKAVGAKTAYIEPGSPWENGSSRLTRPHWGHGPLFMRKLQWADARRITQRRNLLLVARSPNHHRKLEETLQHQATTQCIGLPPTSARSHHPDGPKADHALTFKLDHSSGAAHRRCARVG